MCDSILQECLNPSVNLLLQCPINSVKKTEKGSHFLPQKTQFVIQPLAAILEVLILGESELSSVKYLEFVFIRPHLFRISTWHIHGAITWKALMDSGQPLTHLTAKQMSSVSSI